MQTRTIRERVDWLGAVDWDRRLFDALIPLPDGTSYNAYLVRGSEKTALLDTVDPAMLERCSRQLDRRAPDRLSRRPPRRAGPFRRHPRGAGAATRRPGAVHAARRKGC